MDTWAKVSVCLCVCASVHVKFVHQRVSSRVHGQIPSQKTTLPDPFSDISCGGWEINEEPRGRLSLWAVSLQGKVQLSHTHTELSLSHTSPWQHTSSPN